MTTIHSEGRFPAVCRSIQFNEAGTGNTQAVIGFEFCEVVEDDSSNPQLEPTGEFISYFGAFTDKGTVHTVKALRACGWEGDDLSELPALADSGALANEVSLVIVHEVYNGETKAKVKWVNPPGGGGGKIKLERALDERGLSDFAARMKSRIRAEGGARPSASGTRRPSTGADDRRPLPYDPNGRDKLPF
jgi:hypothetical protein